MLLSPTLIVTSCDLFTRLISAVPNFTSCSSFQPWVNLDVDQPSRRVCAWAIFFTSTFSFYIIPFSGFLALALALCKGWSISKDGWGSQHSKKFIKQQTRGPNQRSRPIYLPLPCDLSSSSVMEPKTTSH